MTCGCPGAYAVGSGVWHTHPVTCTGCGAALRFVVVVAEGLHLCRRCLDAR